MKNCPSCNAACDEATEVCAVCGHSFDAGAPKRTMMGFPSLAAALEEAEKDAPEEPAKHTLFGFPAQKALGAVTSDSEPEPEPEPEIDEDDDAGAATSIISAAAFAAESGSFEAVPPTIEADLRGTVAGLPINSTRDAATEIVSGTAVFPGIRPADDYVEPEDGADDDRRHQGTLMGMSLADINASAPPPAGDGRSTQFAMPAIQAEAIQETSKLETSSLSNKNLLDDGATGTYEPETSKLPADSLAEESDEQIDDSPTQAWAPGSLLAGDKPDQDKRKNLLDKIRSSRSRGTKAASAERPSSEGPDLSALKKLRPKGGLLGAPPADERDTSEQVAAKRPKLPAAGVLRPAKVSATDEVETEEKVQPPKGSLGVPLGEEGSLGESISDPDFGFAETDIASADVLKAVARGMESTPGVSINPPKAPPQPREAPAPARTASPGIYETFNGGSGSAPGRPQPTQRPAQPARPAATQPSPAVPTTVPKSLDQLEEPAQQPQQPQQPRLERPQPKPYQPTPAPSPVAPLQGPAATPYLPGQTDSVPVGSEDPLVGKIQAGFGIGAGVIAIIVQVGVLTTRGLPASKFGVGVIALSVTLAIAAIALALFPLDGKLRSTAYYGIAVALALCFVLGIVSGLPKMFLIIGLGALLALVAGAFPHFTRFLK